MKQLTASALCTLVCCINISKAVPVGNNFGFDPAQSVPDWQQAYNRLLNRKRYQSTKNSPFLPKWSGQTLYSSKSTPMSMMQLPITGANLKSHTNPGVISKRFYSSASWPTLFKMKWKRSEDDKRDFDKRDGEKRDSDKRNDDKRISEKRNDDKKSEDKRHSDFLGNADKKQPQSGVIQDKRSMSYIYDKRGNFKWFGGSPDHTANNDGGLKVPKEPVDYMSGWNSPKKRSKGGVNYLSGWNSPESNGGHKRSDGESLQVGDILSGLSRGFNKRSTQEELDYDNLMALLGDYLQKGIQEQTPYKRNGFLDTYSWIQ